MASAPPGDSNGSPAAPPPLFGVLRLLRIALLPSALCDVVTGLAIGYAGRVPTGVAPWLLIPASLGVYHGAMALNDWADRAEDARVRPDRPIPSGAVPAGVALLIAVTLMLGGALWAAGAGLRAGAAMLAVAALAALYDVAGRGPVRGPLLLGLCRFGNLGVGAAAAYTIEGAATLPLITLLPAAAYGAHVFFIGRLGRLEDEEDDRPLGQRPAAALYGAAATALLIPPAAWWAVRQTAVTANDGAALWGLLLGMLFAGRSAYAILGKAREGAAEGWTRARAEAATGEVLRRLPTTVGGAAATVLLYGNLGLAALIVALAGGRVSGFLRRWFPLT